MTTWIWVSVKTQRQPCCYRQGPLCYMIWWLCSLSLAAKCVPGTHLSSHTKAALAKPLWCREKPENVSCISTATVVSSCRLKQQDTELSNSLYLKGLLTPKLWTRKWSSESLGSPKNNTALEKIICSDLNLNLSVSEGPAKMQKFPALMQNLGILAQILAL